jgi:hypothetical protein
MDQAYRYSHAVISRVRTPSSSTYQSPMNHLDRGQYFLTATHSLGVAWSHGSQARKLKLDYVVVVNHDPSPSS